MEANTTLRWDPYFLRDKDDFHTFWKDYLLSGKHRVLYILGHGFDPRMCQGLEAILNIGGQGDRDCLLISFDEGSDSPSRQLLDLASRNKKQLDILMSNRGQLFNQVVQMWSDKGHNKRRTSSQNAAKIISNLSHVSNYTDVVIDISAMPRAIYFSLIGKLIHLLDQQDAENINLHVIVYEDSGLDEKIRDVGVDDTASYIYGFGSSMDTEASAGIPKVWIPILGENQKVQLQRIHTYFNPDEICPILPFPSKNPRRGDRLLIEYREILFDQWSVEPTNISYASEQNPFDVYRQIYHTAFAP